MESNRQIELIRKYLKDTLSESEWSEFNNFFKEAKVENWQAAIDAENEWLESQAGNDREIFSKNYNKLFNKINKREENRIRWRKLNKVGLAVIPLLSFVVYFAGIFYFNIANERKNEISYQVPACNTQKIELEDQSVLWINNKSTIRYNKESFNKEVREVYLAGQAYFQVKKDRLRPFTVHLDNFQIRVTGTEFDVKSYPDEEEVVVSLVNGSINIGSVSDFEITLKKGQQFIYNKALRHGMVRNVDVDNYIAWRSGEIKYVHTSLKLIAKGIERWFDVKIEIEDPSKQNLILTLNQKNSTLTEALDAISFITRLKYSQQGNEITFYD